MIDRKDFVYWNLPEVSARTPMPLCKTPKPNKDTPPKPNNYKEIAKEIANLVAEKQKFYGNSWGKSEEFLQILYPEGVPVSSYQDMLTIVRIFDKLMRIATDKDALGESPYGDIMGYCLLALNNQDNNI